MVLTKCQLEELKTKNLNTILKLKVLNVFENSEMSTEYSVRRSGETGVPQEINMSLSNGKSYQNHQNKRSKRYNKLNIPTIKNLDEKKNEELNIYQTSPATFSRFKQRLNESKENIKANEIKEEDEDEIDAEIDNKSLYKEKAQVSLNKVKTKPIKNLNSSKKKTNNKFKLPILKINEMNESNDEGRNNLNTKNDNPFNHRSSVSDSGDKSDENFSKSENDDDIYDEEEIYVRPRVERFLSVYELPPEVLLFTQQNYPRIGSEKTKDKSIIDVDQSSSSGSRVFNKPKSPELVKNIHNLDLKPKKSITEVSVITNAYKLSLPNVKKVKTYHNGTGLSQTVKAEIIRNIIKNLDVDKYVKDFKAENATVIKVRSK